MLCMGGVHNICLINEMRELKQSNYVVSLFNQKHKLKNLVFNQIVSLECIEYMYRRKNLFHFLEFFH